MGQKTHPIAFRLGIIKTWKSTWFHTKKYAQYLLEDIEIRKLIDRKLKEGAVARIEIGRTEKETRVTIFSSRPGIIIGRGGTGIEELKRHIKDRIKSSGEIRITIEEIRNPQANARLVAMQVAEQIEKRVSFRRVLKQAIERSATAQGVKGVKIMLSGRLNGAEMSRREWLAQGKMPLHTLRADIDFSRVKAMTTYGVVGVKVWIYRGEIFDQKAGAHTPQVSAEMQEPKERPRNRRTPRDRATARPAREKK